MVENRHREREKEIERVRGSDVRITGERARRLDGCGFEIYVLIPSSWQLATRKLLANGLAHSATTDILFVRLRERVLLLLQLSGLQGN